MSFHPYLFFSNGECAEAFGRYQQIFGGELQMMRNADAPDGVDPMPGSSPDLVMHAAIKIREGLLMGSDDPTGDGGPKVGVAVTYTALDEEEARRVFEALADGGQVFMAFEPTFFSKGFGSCMDRWGVNWMVDTQGDVPA